MTLDEAEQLLERGPEGVREWNRRRAGGEPIPNLRDADFLGLDLTGIDLSGARIVGGCLCGAILDNADLRGTVLYGSSLASVSAVNAIFAGADLRRCEFGIFSIGLGHSERRPDLRGADFTGARLCGADLTETTVAGACFRDADLTGVRWFTADHIGARPDWFNEFETDPSSADLTGARLDEAVREILCRTKPPPPVDSGAWLRERREALGLSPAELAARLGDGLSAYDVTVFLERRADGLPPRLARRLAEIFEVPEAEVPIHRGRPG